MESLKRPIAAGLSETAKISVLKYIRQRTIEPRSASIRLAFFIFM